MRPKLQKRSALKFAGRIIPRAQLSGVISIPRGGGYFTRDLLRFNLNILIINLKVIFFA